MSRKKQSAAKTGERVKVKGTVHSGGFGIHMSGKSLEVDRIDKA